MNTYLLNVWDTWRSSYWFVPTLFTVGAVSLSLAVPLLDAAVARNLDDGLASVAEHIQREEDRDVVKLHAEMVTSINAPCPKHAVDTDSYIIPRILESPA